MEPEIKFITCNCLSDIRTRYVINTLDSKLRFRDFMKEITNIVTLDNVQLTQPEPIAQWFYFSKNEYEIENLIQRQLTVSSYLIAEDTDTLISGNIFHACSICIVKFPRDMWDELLYLKDGFKSRYIVKMGYKQERKILYLDHPFKKNT